MKLPFHSRQITLICSAGGILGMLLRLWLFATADAKGLVKPGHFSDVLVYILLAAVLGLLVLYIRQIPNQQRYSKLFPGNLVSAIGCALGGCGILIHTIGDLINRTSMSLLLLPFGICAFAALLLLAYFRKMGNRPNVVMFAVPLAYLCIHAIAQVRLWSSETQPTVYFFPILATLFLLLAVYYHAHLVTMQKSLRTLVFFSGASAFLCLVSVPQAPIFYLGLAAWMACDSCHIPAQRPIGEDA